VSYESYNRYESGALIRPDGLLREERSDERPPYAVLTMLQDWLKRSAFHSRHQLKAERVQRLSGALHFAKICDSGFLRNALIVWWRKTKPVIRAHDVLTVSKGMGRGGLRVLDP
jgi:hypothetical protein